MTADERMAAYSHHRVQFERALWLMENPPEIRPDTWAKNLRTAAAEHAAILTALKGMM